MRQHALVFVFLIVFLAGCSLFHSEITPDTLVGQTVLVSLESGAFPDSTIKMQFISSKELAWRFTGNIGTSTGLTGYLISQVNPKTIIVTWRSKSEHVSYVVTMDFGSERCFMVRVDHGKNLLSEGVVAFE
ncbi:hypothetical protein [Halodesulfovibrio aestuarii]|uniref:Molybdenum cofactor biosynthesis protein F N-terminal domain-containing protein n=1 Tax=Halodesulfovibrio aestuarii TaxID=126333 RepID=A0ABV4JVM0_9BACT